jgi:hypothetical protein
MRATCDRVDEAELTLAKQGMPPDEIRAVLGADDPRIVRRHLELHRERLEERLNAEQLAVDLVEQVLADQIGRPRG